MSQRSHGRVGYRDRVPWRYDTTLPGELAKAGYHTQGVGKMHFYPARNLCGFHNVVLHDGYLHCERSVNKRLETVDDYMPWFRERAGAAADFIDHGVECNSWVARPWNYDENLHPTNWVVTKSIEFLNRRDPGKPFFLWMSFVRPHSPLDPPQAYWDMYRDAEIPPPPVGDWAKEFPEGSVVDASGFEGRLDRRAFERARRAYYALITHIDHQIGRFREALHEYGLLSNTLVLFTSDHGDLLGDHNLLRKALPYEGSARIPLVAYSPPAFDMGFERGSVIDRPVELRDIMPTCLEAAGAPVPQDVEGLSLLPLARGEKTAWREYVHGEHT
jgi:arylsulfatase A-like enzyme